MSVENTVRSLVQQQPYIMYIGVICPNCAKASFENVLCSTLSSFITVPVKFIICDAYTSCPFYSCCGYEIIDCQGDLDLFFALADTIVIFGGVELPTLKSNTHVIRLFDTSVHSLDTVAEHAAVDIDNNYIFGQNRFTL